MQVSSRLLLVHGIVHPFPEAAGRGNPFYTSMVLAWSITEVVRYSFFVTALSQGSAGSGSRKDDKGVPAKRTVVADSSVLGGALTWLRYNTFFVLYPVGISSEVMCLWKAMGEMKRLARGSVGMGGDGLYGLGWWACVGILAVYVPGSWVLYTYMMAQRRKTVVRGKR